LFDVKRRYPQAKKHKTWDGDGVLKLEGDRYYLFGIDGKKYVKYDLFGSYAHFTAAWDKVNICSVGP
jgi:hypothetical protein